MEMNYSKRLLVITVDTEEEGLWGGSYAITGNTTENLRGLPKFQSVCEAHGAPPTYLIDAPVTENAEAMRLMSRWQQEQRCEVGAHCHPWCNPPLDSRPPTGPETFLSNLPMEVQYEKLNWLTDRISDVTGKRPASYRSGRYGLNDDTATVLDDLGYQVDSSVLPLYEYVREQGPDFRNAKRKPHKFFGEESNRTLLEIPITSGFIKPGYSRQRRLWLRLREMPWRRFRAAGIADRLGFARRVKLTPENTRLSDQRKLIDACVADGLSILVLMLHSSSFTVGTSPYVPTSEALDDFYERLNGTISYAISEYCFQPISLTGAASRLTTASEQL